jgi:formiminotetrahydrofolate cyclodeaminase
MPLIDSSLREVLRQFRAPSPTPGGGSAAALAGAIGAALLAMVAGLPKPRTATEEDAARLAAAGDRCAASSDRLASLVDLDSDAYDGVVAAFRLPKTTDEEKTVRSAAIQDALRMATETPLEAMRVSAAALEQGVVVASFGNPNASSDVRVGLELLAAALGGAKLNVDANLSSVKDPSFVERVRDESARLLSEAGAEVAAAHHRLER